MSRNRRQQLKRRQSLKPVTADAYKTVFSIQPQYTPDPFHPTPSTLLTCLRERIPSPSVARFLETPVSQRERVSLLTQLPDKAVHIGMTKVPGKHVKQLRTRVREHESRPV